MADEYKVAVDHRHAVELDDGRTIAPGQTVEVEDPDAPEAAALIEEGILVKWPPEEPDDGNKKATTPKKATAKKEED